MLIHEIGPQSYGKVADVWYVRPPSARRAMKVDPAVHHVEEHDDGTISVFPSLVHGEPGQLDYWHGWLVRGRFVAA